MELVIANGFLLAGGRSSRMGEDKGLLDLDGRTLIEIGLEKLRTVCVQVSLLGNQRELERFGVPVIADAQAECGPLGGIVAGLEASASEWNLFLAVDVPFVPVEVLQMLLKAAKGERALCVMAEAGAQPQPLVALYARAALPVLKQELEAGRLRVMKAIQAAGTVSYLHFSEGDWFRNLNTPEDYAAARSSYVRS